MKKIVLTYSKISWIITLAESVYLFIGLIYPKMLRNFNHFNLIEKGFFYTMAFLFFICYWNVFLLLISGIILLFRKSTIKFGLISIVVCVIFYFTAKYSIGYGL